MTTSKYFVLAATFALGIVACLVWQMTTGDSQTKGDKLFGRPPRVETRTNYSDGARQLRPTRSTQRPRIPTESSRPVEVTLREIDSLMVETGLEGQLSSMKMAEEDKLLVREARENALIQLGRIEALHSARYTDEEGEYIEVSISDEDVDDWHGSIEGELKTNFGRNRSVLLARMLMADISYMMGSDSRIELRVGKDPYEPTKDRMSIKGLTDEGILIGETYLIGADIEERWGHLLDETSE